MQSAVTPAPHFSAAPRLETERLILRANLPDDLTPFMAMWAEPDFHRHLGGQPITEEEAWTKLLRNAGLWPILGFGYWAVEEQATGRFIGHVGFADFQRAIEPSLKGIPEIGWVLAPAVHGRGYATEAVRAVLAWGDAQFSSRRTVCIIDPANTASLRVAEKCGYHYVAETRYKEHPILLLERIR
jgi:RimJ/RimL family protein N-acetyltransferase